MNYKTSKAARTTVTRNIPELTKHSEGNIYEAINVISKRSNQISSELKEELIGKLNEFASTTDNLEEVFENREQIEISRYFERIPKATALAIEELENEEIYTRPVENKEQD